MSLWTSRIEERNEAITAGGRWRRLRPLDGGGPRFTTPDGAPVVSFASNDYLGLSQHPAVRAAATSAIEQMGTGSGSARLIVGDRPLHHTLEDALADWKGTEAALLFATGFAANLGVLSTFATDGVLVISDELNHASIIDGCRLSKGQVAIAQHDDMAHVAELLDMHTGPAIVVTDTVFSMDGDVADLSTLGALCRDRGALLIVDEAHGVLGPAWTPPPGLDVLRVGTLSKTLGSLGGFVAGPRPFIDALVNSARSFIFTTGTSPADAAAALAALSVLRSPEGAALVARLRSLTDRIRPRHPSPIVPIIIGNEGDAVAAAEQLLVEHGLLVPAIRPPTVPPGTSRLRVTVSAAHADADIERLATALVAVAPALIG
jgi:8-amino-7-oxononanoate synthase